MYKQAKADIYSITGVQINSKEDLLKISTTNQQTLNAKMYLEKNIARVLTNNSLIRHGRIMKNI
jgi:hypothetical protein